MSIKLKAEKTYARPLPLLFQIPQNGSLHEVTYFPTVYYHTTLKIKFTLEQAMKAQRGSRGKDLLFL